MQIKNVHIKDILYAENSDYLFNEYFAEGKTGLIANIEVNKELFMSMYNADILDCFGVYASNKLVGFIVASTTPSPHYGGLATMVMSIFILKAYRKSGTAKKLISSIEQCAKNRGSKLVILSSPVNGILSKFAPIMGYRQSNILYGKAI